MSDAQMNSVATSAGRMTDVQAGTLAKHADLLAGQTRSGAPTDYTTPAAQTGVREVGRLGVTVGYDSSTGSFSNVAASAGFRSAAAGVNQELTGISGFPNIASGAQKADLERGIEFYSNVNLKGPAGGNEAMDAVVGSLDVTTLNRAVIQDKMLSKGKFEKAAHAERVQQLAKNLAVIKKESSEVASLVKQGKLDSRAVTPRQQALLKFDNDLEVGSELKTIRALLKRELSKGGAKVT